MTINDDDITLEPGADEEGPADGGANPGGHDGGADGSAAEGEGTADGGANPKDTTAVPTVLPTRAKVPPTAEPIPAAMTAAPTVPRSDRRGARPGSRPALSRCIRVPADEFADRYWGREPLLSTADDLAVGFDDLFSAGAVDELVSRRGVRTPFIRMAYEGSVLAASAYTASGGLGAEIADQVSSEKVLAEFAGGATIVLQGLHRLWPPIIDFTRALVDDVGHPAQVNAYVTPPSSRGFDARFDTHDVFVLQISGEKHWRIHAPVLVDPLRTQPWDEHRAAVARAATHEPVIDAVLRPGDALYLPRGWIHSATALGATSVHLTVGISAYTRADIVEALLGQVGDSAALRASLPLGVDLRDPEAFTPIVEQTMQALIETLKQTDASRPAAILSSRFDADTRPRAGCSSRDARRARDARRVDPGAVAQVAAGAHSDGRRPGPHRDPHQDPLAARRSGARRAPTRHRRRGHAGGAPGSRLRECRRRGAQACARGSGGGARVTSAAEHWAPCSDRARERGDPLFGTGPRGERWFLIEVAASWGRNALLDEPFDRELGRALVGRIEGAGMRPLAIRRTGRRHHSDDAAVGDRRLPPGSRERAVGRGVGCRGPPRGAARRFDGGPVVAAALLRLHRPSRPVLRGTRSACGHVARRGAPPRRRGSAPTSGATGSPERWWSFRTASTTAMPTTATRCGSPTPSTTVASCWRSIAGAVRCRIRCRLPSSTRERCSATIGSNRFRR